MRSVILSFAMGAVGGALVGFGVWWVASKKLESDFERGAARLGQDLGVGAEELRRRLDAGRLQLRQDLAVQVAQQVPPAVADSVEMTFNRYGLTKERVRQVNAVLDRAQQQGWL